MRWEKADLSARFGTMGERLWHLARGEDNRRVMRDERPKSISKETTFEIDTADAELLDGHLWRLAEQVADRAKAKGLAGRVVTLKLKLGDFRQISRRHALAEPTQLADRIYRVAREMLDQLGETGSLRLIGTGLAEIVDAPQGDASGDLFDPDAGKRAATERATDAIRARFGAQAIIKGRSLR